MLTGQTERIGALCMVFQTQAIAPQATVKAIALESHHVLPLTLTVETTHVGFT